MSSEQTTKDWLADVRDKLNSLAAECLVSGAEAGDRRPNSRSNGQRLVVDTRRAVFSEIGDRVQEIADALPETREPVVVTEAAVERLAMRQCERLASWGHHRPWDELHPASRGAYLQSAREDLEAALDSTSQSPVPDGPQYPPAERLIESLRWAVGYIDRLKKFGPEMPSGDTADWMEWASAHDWLKDAEMASQSPVEDVEGDEELKRFVPTGRRSQMVENQFGDWVRLADVVRKVEGILAVHERHVELLVEERIEAERDRDSRLTKEQCVEKLEALPVAYRRAGVGPPIPTIDRARALAAFKEEVPDA